MKTINMHEAKTQLSRVVEEIARTGEVYLICRNGEPVAELRSYSPPANPLMVDPDLKVLFHEDPTAPIEPGEWPEAFE
jgi:prevent-host-death family protein